MNRVFISYVRENMEMVDRLYQDLRSHGIQVWLDRNEIDPGARWKYAIQKAIREGAYFVACFSKEYNDRDKTYMNEELTIAIEELRQRHNDRISFIPVKLNDCEIPDRDIGGGETLRDLQYVNLFEDWDGGIQKILRVVQPSSSKPVDVNASEHQIDQNADAYYIQGMKYSKSEDFNHAIQCFTKALDLNSNFAEAHFRRAYAYMSQQDFLSAINDYSRAIDLSPDFAAAYQSRGSVYIGFNNFVGAIDDLSKAIDLNPGNSTAYDARGVAYHVLENFHLALRDYSKAIDLNPNFANAYNHRGTAYSDKGEYERAIEDFNKAIQLNPNDANVYDNRGLAYARKGENDHAVSDYSKAIDLKSDFAKAYHNRGVAWLHLQEWEKARTDLTTAKNMGADIVAWFQAFYANVDAFRERNGFELPEDIAAMLTPPAD